MKFLFLALIVSTSLLAEKKSMEEYWMDVGLTFKDVLENVLVEKTCYATSQEFLGCMHGLNAMIAYSGKGLVLVPEDRIKAEGGFGKSEGTFGPLSLVPPKKLKSNSIADIYAFAKEQRALATKAWGELFKKSATVKVPIKDILNSVMSQEYFKKKESAVVGNTLNSILAVVVDPHTQFVPTKMIEDGGASVEKFVGIGVYLKQIEKNGIKVLMISSPIEGGPAHAAGVRAGDIIVEVNGKKVEGLPLGEVSALLKGERGQKVKVTVLRDGKNMTIEITRDDIKIENVAGKLNSDGAVPVGHVRFRSFMKEKGCEDVESTIKDLEKKGAKALIFDLRDNGGGYLTQAVCVANLYLDKLKTVLSVKGLIPQVKDKNHDTTVDSITKLPVVTLVNAGSASASEILAGALQDHKRSFVVGERTFGKGTVQTQEARGAITLRRTIARFLLPTGRTNQIEGVIPDVTVYSNPNPTKDDMVAFREEDEYAALPTLGAPWKQTRPDAVKELSECMSTGLAKKLYQDGLTKPIAPDYQALSAADAAVCLAQGKPAVTGLESPGLTYKYQPEPQRSMLERGIRENMSRVNL